MAGKTLQTDILVIGGGPGGYAAAFRAADLGREVTLVESDERLGGVCLLKGCIPSKALLHVASLIREAQEAKKWGVTFQDPGIDLDALRSWKERILTRLSKGLEGLCKKRKVDVVHGRAVFEGSERVRLEDGDGAAAVMFNHVVLATGSSPVSIPGLDIESPRVMDSTSALAMEEVPGTLLVVGGGYIGLELGTVYAALGSKVTVVELTDGLLPGVDRDLVKPLSDQARKTFEGVHLDTRVRAVSEVKGGIAVTLEGDVPESEVIFDRVLVSVGRRPNTLEMGLETTSVEVDDRGYVVVDSQQRTGDPHILAVGDVVAGPGLAHKATHEGKVAAEVLAGRPAAFDSRAIPAVVFTDPEVAWCGPTESEAKAEGMQVEVATFPWGASGRAATLGRSDGLTKLVIDRVTQRVLGVGIVGPGAGELIAEGALAVEMGAVAEDLALTIHPHPTLSESLSIAAEVFLGTATDLYVPKRT